MTRADPSLAREFEAALAWWRAAGVDCDFTDDATAWLADAPLDAAPGADVAAARALQASPATGENRPAAPERIIPQRDPAPAVARRNLLGDSPPVDLAAFRLWWLEGVELGPPGSFPRIAPRGQTAAALMVLVPQPEELDREQLLAGLQGRLLANILAAMGLEDSAVYIACALPCHTPMADLAAIAASGMDAVLAHHIALVQPQRLLVFGTALGEVLTRIKDEPLRAINQSLVNTPVMVSETLDAMMEMPRLKARFWKRWIEWSAPV
jgi:uracil-DNA glycosylase